MDWCPDCQYQHCQDGKILTIWYATWSWRNIVNTQNLYYTKLSRFRVTTCTNLIKAKHSIYINQNHQNTIFEIVKGPWLSNCWSTYQNYSQPYIPGCSFCKFTVPCDLILYSFCFEVVQYVLYEYCEAYFRFYFALF